MRVNLDIIIQWRGNNFEIVATFEYSGNIPTCDDKINCSTSK